MQDGKGNMPIDKEKGKEEDYKKKDTTEGEI